MRPDGVVSLAPGFGVGVDAARRLLRRAVADDADVATPVFTCPGATKDFQPCPNNRSDGGPRCAEGNTGPLCAHCAEGYGRDEGGGGDGGPCKLCGNTHPAVPIILSLLALAGVAFLMYKWVHNGVSNGRQVQLVLSFGSAAGGYDEAARLKAALGTELDWMPDQLYGVPPPHIALGTLGLWVLVNVRVFHSRRSSGALTWYGVAVKRLPPLGLSSCFVLMFACRYLDGDSLAGKVGTTARTAPNPRPAL